MKHQNRSMYEFRNIKTGASNRKRSTAAMAEATVESQNTILPEDLIIEILSRVEPSDYLQLRCVCKWWKSLVFDRYLLEKHIRISVTEIMYLVCNAIKRLKPFELHRKEEEDEEAVEEEDFDDEEEDFDDEEDDAEVVEEEDFDDEEEEVDGEEDVDDEEEDNGAGSEEEKESAWKVVIEFLRQKEAVPLDNFLKGIKEQYESIRDDMQIAEDRVKCLQNILQVRLSQVMNQ